MQPQCPRQTQTTKDRLMSRNCKTNVIKYNNRLPNTNVAILLSSMIIYHLRDTLLNINYLSFLKPLK